MAYVVMAYVVMAYVAMAYIVMAYVVAAYIVMAHIYRSAGMQARTLRACGHAGTCPWRERRQLFFKKTRTHASQVAHAAMDYAQAIPNKAITD